MLKALIAKPMTLINNTSLGVVERRNAERQTYLGNVNIFQSSLSNNSFKGLVMNTPPSLMVRFSSGMNDRIVEWEA